MKLQARLASDPDVKPGDILTLERADGRRSVWRQRLRVSTKTPGPFYHLEPINEMDQPQ